MNITGKLLRKNYQYTRKSLDVLPDDVERVMTALESAEYVLGASFISRGSGASAFALVMSPASPRQRKIFNIENELFVMMFY